MKVDFVAIFGIIFIYNILFIIWLIQVKIYWCYKVIQLRDSKPVLSLLTYTFKPDFRKLLYIYYFLSADENDTPAIEHLRSRHNWLCVFIVGDFTGTLLLGSIPY
ncbi:hypothetical protein GGR92_001322 [Spirosoma lacussanchae]